jgi:hypothetical protein
MAQVTFLKGPGGQIFRYDQGRTEETPKTPAAGLFVSGVMGDWETGLPPAPEPTAPEGMPSEGRDEGDPLASLAPDAPGGGAAGTPEGEGAGVGPDDLPFDQLNYTDKLTRIQAKRAEWLAANEGATSDQVNLAMGRFDYHEGMAERQMQLERAAAAEEALAWVKAGKDPNDLPPGKISALSGDQLNVLQNVFRRSVTGTAVFTDPRAMWELRNMQLELDEKGRPALYGVDLMEYADRLSFADLESMMATQAEVRRVVMGIEAEARAEFSPVEAQGEALEMVGSAMGYVQNMFPMRKDDPAYYAVAESLLQWAVDQAGKTGKPVALIDAVTRARALSGTLQMTFSAEYLRQGEAGQEAADLNAAAGLNAGRITRRENMDPTRTPSIDFRGMTQTTADDFTVERAAAAIANNGLVINGRQVSAAFLDEAQDAIQREFPALIASDPAIVNQLVYMWMAEKLGYGVWTDEEKK